MKVIYFKYVADENSYFYDSKDSKCFKCEYEANSSGQYRTINSNGTEGWVIPEVIILLENGGSEFWKPITKGEYEWESIK